MADLEKLIWEEIWTESLPENNFPEKTPHIAHYTSIENIKNILSGEELWFSNPLYMNDSEELQYGMNTGQRLLHTSKILKAAFTNNSGYNSFLMHFNNLFQDYAQEHVFDTYIACFSEIDIDDNDGKLSMWRGYGDSGNGAAIIFDVSKFGFLEGSPLVVSKVEYGSSKDREKWIDNSINNLAKIIQKVDQSPVNLEKIAKLWLERLKIYSLCTKHIGFIEESEWRIIYMPERDIENALSKSCSYHILNGEVEPKLKLEIKPLNGVINSDLSLEEIVNRIILGPSPNNKHSLSKKTFGRMLIDIEKNSLIESLHVSTIPFRQK